MARVNKLVLDEQSEARFTIGGGFLPDDKSQAKGWQEGILWSTAGIEKGGEMFTQARAAVNAFRGTGQGSGKGVGGSPSSKDMEEFDEYFRRMTAVRNEKAAHSAGNYATLPSPAKPKVNLRPKSVETRYPD